MAAARLVETKTPSGYRKEWIDAEGRPARVRGACSLHRCDVSSGFVWYRRTPREVARATHLGIRDDHTTSVTAFRTRGNRDGDLVYAYRSLNRREHCLMIDVDHGSIETVYNFKTGAAVYRLRGNVMVNRGWHGGPCWDVTPTYPAQIGFRYRTPALDARRATREDVADLLAAGVPGRRAAATIALGPGSRERRADRAVVYSLCC